VYDLDLPSTDDDSWTELSPFYTTFKISRETWLCRLSAPRIVVYLSYTSVFLGSRRYWPAVYNQRSCEVGFAPLPVNVLNEPQHFGYLLGGRHSLVFPLRILVVIKCPLLGLKLVRLAFTLSRPQTTTSTT